MFGLTPLRSAVFNGHKEIVGLLVAEGADVNAKDDRGETPLDWAIQTNNPFGSAEIADLLRKHGGKAKTPDFAFTFLVITTHLRKARNRQK